VTDPEQFPVLADGLTREQRDARLADGAAQLANGHRHTLLGNERLLLALAAGLMTFGVSLILVGWYGAAHATVVEEQVPYLISGGLIGVALSVIGAMCLLAHWLTVLIGEARAREVVRRNDHAELMAALRAAPIITAEPEGKSNGSPRSEKPQRPVRRASHRS
jgi:hypothetical protein